MRLLSLQDERDTQVGSPGSWAQTGPEEALKSIQALKGRQDFQDLRLERGRDSEDHEGNQ